MYDYIASNNTEGAVALCNKYGYNPNPSDIQEISESLKSIVADNGEEGLNSIIDIHPEKEIFVHFIKVRPAGTCGDGCTGSFYKDAQRMLQSYPTLGADGTQSSMQPANLGIISQTNIFIIAAALLLAVAVIAKK